MDGAEKLLNTYNEDMSGNDKEAWQHRIEVTIMKFVSHS